jgi:hypothetical protein
LAQLRLTGDNPIMSGTPALYSPNAMRAEKRAVAGNSVVAALFVTAGKTVVGVTTGSLGILSEAAHSALDLIAALLTYFSVGVSDKPADADHQYGHGKVENFSAFVGYLRSGHASVLPPRRGRAFHLGLRRDADLDGRRLVAFPRPRPHRHQV